MAFLRNFNQGNLFPFPVKRLSGVDSNESVLREILVSRYVNMCPQKKKKRKDVVVVLFQHECLPVDIKQCR